MKMLLGINREILASLFIKLLVLLSMVTNVDAVKERASIRDRVEQIKRALDNKVEINPIQEKQLSSKTEMLDKKTSEELVFSPFTLSLEEAIEYAVLNNLSFRNSYGLLEIATRNVTASKASLFEPTLQLSYDRRATNNPAQGFIPQFTSQVEGGSLSYSQQFNDGTNVILNYATNNSSSSLRDQQNNTGLQLQIRRSLFGKSNSFYANETGLRNARIDKRIAYTEYLDSYQALVVKVIEAYLNTVKAQRQIGVSESVLRSRQELLDLTQIKFNLGVSTKLDVLRVEVQVAGEEELLIQARNTFQNRLDALLNILNYDDPPQTVEVSFDEERDSNKLDYSTKLNENLSRALQERLDIKIAKLRLSQQKNSLRNAQEQIKNKVELSGSLRKHATDSVFSASQDFSDRNWSLGLRYDYPLGNRRNRENLFSQRVRLDNSERQLEELRLRVGLEVRNAQRSIVSTRERIKVLKKNLARARENLKLARLSYEKGIKSSIEVLDAQDDLQDVNKNYINTMLDLKIAEFRLLRSMGTIGIPESIMQKAQQWLSVKN